MFRTRYRPRTWKVQCDVSGFVTKSDMCVQRWDGRMVIREFNEQRHPQEFLKTPPDTQSVPWNRHYTTSNEIPTAGVGVWAIGSTFVVAPDSTLNNTVALDNWLSNEWTYIVTH